MFQCKKPKSSRGVRRARKFRSRDIRITRYAVCARVAPRKIKIDFIFLGAPIEGFHVTSLQQNLPSHAAHSGHVGSHKIWPNHTLDTLGTLPDIAANARPLRAVNKM